MTIKWLWIFSFLRILFLSSITDFCRTWLCVAGTTFPSGPPGLTPGFMLEYVLLIFLLLRCARPVSCVPNVASGLSTLDSIFSNVYYLLLKVALNTHNSILYHNLWYSVKGMAVWVWTKNKVCRSDCNALILFRIYKKVCSVQGAWAFQTRNTL